MRNLRHLYYHDYFDNIDFRFIKDGANCPATNIAQIANVNRELCTSRLETIMPRPAGVNSHLRFKVLYPGLVTGVGISHETSVEGEFKLGMHFDYTYGLPVIYGSTVKGVLREHLKDVVEDSNSDIEKAIFEGGTSIYNRDIFFDAVIVKGCDNDGHILAPDSITPHKGAFKNPIPIPFMKIASGCIIEFRFVLVNSNVNGKVITLEKKLEWFQKILLDYGVGAKTNVGYGQLKKVADEQDPR